MGQTTEELLEQVIKNRSPKTRQKVLENVLNKEPEIYFDDLGNPIIEHKYMDKSPLNTSKYNDVSIQKGPYNTNNFRDVTINELSTNENYRKRPSIEAYLANRKALAPEFTENSTVPLPTIGPKQFIEARIAQLPEQTPAERARLGAKLGTSIGITGSNGSIKNGLIGAAIGAYAGRAAGYIATGEAEQEKKYKNVVNVLDTMGISDNGKLMFMDGTDISLQPTPSNRLPNLYGNSKRSIFELDSSNPLTRRSKAIATPIAHILSRQLAKDKDPKTLQNTVASLTNALQKGATSIQDVYVRAKELSSKLGVPEQDMRAYFESIKNTLSKEEAKDIADGLGALYG